MNEGEKKFSLSQGCPMLEELNLTGCRTLLLMQAKHCSEKAILFSFFSLLGDFCNLWGFLFFIAVTFLGKIAEKGSEKTDEFKNDFS